MRATATAPDGAILIDATFVHNEATELRLPEAKLARAQPPPGKEPVSGAGGIEFGTASLQDFASMRCGQRQCLTALVHDLAGQMMVSDADKVRDAWDIQFPDSIPNPVPGAREYVVSVGVADGVREVEAKFHFDLEEECERERARIDGLLREKYGECMSVYDEVLIGQCDARGLRERTAEVSSCFSMPDENFVRLVVDYDYRNQAVRDGIWRAIEEARLRRARPGAEDL